MNCFKPQNSEENPLILMNKANSQQGMNKSKSNNSLKTNEIINNNVSAQSQQQINQILEQNLQLQKNQLIDRMQAYEDEIDQKNYQMYLNQLENSKKLSNFLMENDRRQQQQQQQHQQQKAIEYYNNSNGNNRPFDQNQLYFRQPQNVIY